jgi:hypothetical protein
MSMASREAWVMFDMCALWCVQSSVMVKRMPKNLNGASSARKGMGWLSMKITFVRSLLSSVWRERCEMECSR